jgi:benzoyl-CoA-dihydrodiol lyase
VDGEERASITLSDANFGTFPMSNGLSRLESRFYREDDHLAWLAREKDRSISPGEAHELGLVTDAPDDIDWEDEVFAEALLTRAGEVHHAGTAKLLENPR